MVGQSARRFVCFAGLFVLLVPTVASLKVDTTAHATDTEGSFGNSSSGCVFSIGQNWPNADTYCFQAASFPEYTPENAGCTSCRWLQGVESAEHCHDAVRRQNSLTPGCLSEDFTFLSTNGRCWPKRTGHSVSYSSGFTSGDLGASDCVVSNQVSNQEQQVSGTGDPHLQNIHGERFDLLQPGNHILINIPRGTPAKSALLRVEATARRVGGDCDDMYFQAVNVSGSWAEEQRPGGFQYTKQASHETPNWTTLGKIAVKVVHGRTQGGVEYLNVYVRHLGASGFAVGGLLGEDDHAEASKPPVGCERVVNLQMRGEDVRSFSVAIGTK